MTYPQRRAVMSLSLCLMVAQVWAQDDTGCDLSQIFDMDAVRAACPIGGSDIDITLRWAQSMQANATRMQNVKDQLGPRLAESKILVADFRSTGAGPRTLAASAERSTILPALARIVTRAETGSTYRSVSVLLPPNSLICGETLNAEEVIVPLQLIENAAPSTKLSCGPSADDGVQGKALGWRIDLSPIDNGSGDGSEAAIDFNLDKTWGYNFKTDTKDYLSWSENTWKLKLDGALSTDTNTFYNSLRGEIAWSYKKYKLGEKATRSLFPVYWLSAHLGPEASSDLNNRDFVYGARADAFLNTGGIARALIPGMQSTASIRPFVSFGIEAVDPNKREDGTVPDNYERLSGKFWWQLPVTKSVFFEVRWEPLYILDGKDADNMMVDQFTDRLDLVVSMAVGGSDEVRPFFKWTKGQRGPLFQDVEEYLIGILWELGGASSERQ